MAKEIMKTNDLNFCDRPKLLLATILSYNATDIAFSTYGEHWRQLRKICVVELLSEKRVLSFRFIREEEGLTLVKSISSSEGSIVNLSHMISSMITAITTRAAFGEKSRHQQAFKSIMSEIINLFGGLCIADLYPSIKMLQRLSSAKTKLEKLQRELDMILQDIINDHKISHKEESKDGDLVDALLKIQQENDHSQNPLTDDGIKSVIQDMFTAGTETSSEVILWGMSEMLPNEMKNEELDMTESFEIIMKRKHDLCLIPLITRRL
ncbi:cytochrome P450 71D10 [Trifolium repens]|nr:cytochrome P450 71D10 [Trifolium repens]